MSTRSALADNDLAQIFKKHAVAFRRARAANLSFLVCFGQARLRVSVLNGAVAAVDDLAVLPPLQSYDFSVKADADAWCRFWQRMPEAGSHDIFALTRYGHMAIEGNLYPLMANLQFVKDLLAVGRGELP